MYDRVDDQASAAAVGTGPLIGELVVAVAALAWVFQQLLEDGKRLLRTTLFTDDETALFHIANRFDLRHRNDKQHTDYDPAFRDWVFWWYLGTIELTDRLLARNSPSTP